ncbi:hypothetical protein ACFSCX_06590 [Bacillus salitolerans]|uniref:Uncharacterized protein n=1 Tax=Bacillus salitolerans TaxID=1437434 RepID=A0ABW4LMB8_9BACI
MPNQDVLLVTYPNREGDVPVWDHPLLRGYRKVPKDHYYPYTSLAQVLSIYKRQYFTEEDLVLLKVLGDCICANEDQIRRLFTAKTEMSRSEVSKRLDQFRKFALVERWSCRIEREANQRKPPAPFSLGVAGFILMRHLYGDQFFKNPDNWQGIMEVQRYVAMNEVRTRLVESGNIRDWKWNVLLGGNPRNDKPFGVAKMETPKGYVNILFERAQQSQNFVGFLRKKLDNWRRVNEVFGKLPLSEFDEHTSMVVISVSTKTVAEYLHEQLLLDQYKDFQVMLCIDEYFDEGFERAFFVANGPELKRVQLSFVAPTLNLEEQEIAAGVAHE